MNNIVDVINSDLYKYKSVMIRPTYNICGLFNALASERLLLKEK